MIYRSLNILKGVTVSHQTNYITHAGTKFQTSEKCFPNQFCHPNEREAAFSNKAIESMLVLNGMGRNCRGMYENCRGNNLIRGSYPP